MNAPRDATDPDSPGVAPLDDVLVTERLAHRPSRPTDHEAENRVLVELAEKLARRPDTLLQRLVDAALELCRADSTGVSLLEEGGAVERFRWNAVAGPFSTHQGGTIPRDRSPCGAVLERDDVLLFDRPSHHYTELRTSRPGIREALLVPFHVGGRPRGTLWAIAHSEERRFDREDARLLTSLSRFVSVGYQLRIQARRKDWFLAMLGHELRNPLAPLTNAVELLKRDDLTESRKRRLVPVLDRQVGHLTRLVDDLLDISRIAEGKLALETRTLDLVHLVRQVVDDHRRELDAAELQLEMRLPDEPLWIDGDPSRLTQTVANLIGNAAKYTEPGGDVRVRVQRVDGGSAARVTVEDTGAGMTASLLDHVFEPFHQGPRGPEHGNEGMGIGLTLVRLVVEAHDGRVWAESEGRGRGSCIHLRLPLLDPDAAREEAADADPGSDDDGPQRRVLLVEDRPDAAQMTKMVLEQEGHEVAVAPDGESGLEEALRFRPEVVFCDLGLPGPMTGYDVAKSFRADERLASARLVALTGYGETKDREAAEAAGFDAFLTKPVRVGALERAVEPTSDAPEPAANAPERSARSRPER